MEHPTNEGREGSQSFDGDASLDQGSGSSKCLLPEALKAKEGASGASLAEGLGAIVIDHLARDGAPGTSGEAPPKGKTVPLWALFASIASAMALAGLAICVTFAVTESNGAHALQRERERQQSTCLTPTCVNAASALLRSVDLTADPCEDFYQHVCGSYIADRPMWNTRSGVSKLSEASASVQGFLVAELLRAEADRDGALGKAGEFFQQCMDTRAMDQLGALPLESALAPVREGLLAAANATGEAKSRAVFEAVRDVHARLATPLFVQYITAPDDEDSTRHLLNIRQGRLGVSDKDFYLTAHVHEEQGQEQEDTRKDAYRHAVHQGLALLQSESGAAAASIGGSPPEAEDLESQVDAVIGMEAQLAQCHEPESYFRDPAKRYNPMSVGEADGLFPMQWAALVRSVSGAEMENVNVESPDALRCLARVLQEAPVEQTFAYIRWHVLLFRGSSLGGRLRAWNKHVRALVSGSNPQETRVRHCIDRTQTHFGFALSKVLIDQKVAAGSKTSALRVADAVVDALTGAVLPRMEWMSEGTKASAAAKAEAMRKQVGYPEWVRSGEKVAAYYEGLGVRDDFFESETTAEVFAKAADLRKVNEAVDKANWYFPPSFLNAYYSATENKLTVPASLFQQPFFDPGLPAALNYGTLGFIMGHEIIHGFDSLGRQYDGEGNLHDWWTDLDEAAFEERSQCFARQYGGYGRRGLFTDGNATLQENVADNGGLQLALEAFENHGGNLTLPGAAWTPEQLFFLGFGHIWCSSSSEREEATLIASGHHSLSRFRVNGAVSNSELFSQAFQCKPGAGMNPASKCVLYG